MKFGANTKIQMFGITKYLRDWCDEYELSPKIVYQRYMNGIRDQSLFDPVDDDILDKNYVHRLWGGKWVEKTEVPRKKKRIYTKPVRWNKTQKWVYVGKIKIA